MARSRRNVWALMLNQVPGVGKEAARAIQSRYPSPKDLVEVRSACHCPLPTGCCRRGVSLPWTGLSALWRHGSPERQGPD